MKTFLDPFLLCFITSGVSGLRVAADCAASCGVEPWPGQRTVSEPSYRWSSSCCEPAQWPGQGSSQCLFPARQCQWQQQFVKVHWMIEMPRVTWNRWKLVTFLPECLEDSDIGDWVLLKNTLVGSSAVSDCVDRFLCSDCSADGSLTL